MNMKNAFTLVELLVVITIITTLAGLLFPVFGQAKAAAKKTQCLVHSRETGMGLQLYLGDHDDMFPQEHPSSSDPSHDDNLAQLEGVDYGSPFDKILPYVGESSSLRARLYICPSDPDPHGVKLLDEAGNCKGSAPLAPPPGSLTSYVLNAYYLFGLNGSRVTSPSQSIYISERNDSFCDVHYHPWLGETDMPNPLAIASRHTDVGNYIYADGYAKTRPFAATRQSFQDHLRYGEHQAF